MKTWTERMLAAKRAAAGLTDAEPAPTAPQAPIVAIVPIGGKFRPTGTIGTIGPGTAPSAGSPTAVGSDLPALSALSALAEAPPPPPMPEPSDAIDAFHERLSICIEGSDVPESEAHRIAAEQVGAGLEVLAARQVVRWRGLLDAMPAPAAPDLAQLRAGVLALMGEPWVLDAALLGWDDVATFGINPHAPTVRVDAWGLASGLVLSPYNRPHRPVRVVAVEADRAVLELPSGARPIVGRRYHGLAAAVPLWAVELRRNAA